MTKEIGESVLSAAARAAELFDEGTLDAVMIIGLYRDDHKVKIWHFGNEQIVDLMNEAIRTALPLMSSRHKSPTQ